MISVSKNAISSEDNAPYVDIRSNNGADEEKGLNQVLRGDMFVPTLKPESYRTSPRHTFVPLRFSPSPFEARRDIKDTDIPPISPADVKRVFSPFANTPTTVDTLESYATLSPPTVSPLPLIPGQSQLGMGQEMTSLQRALWVPPRNIAVCQFINEASNKPRASSISPSLGYGAFVPPSQTQLTSHKALFATPRDESDPIRKSRIKTELCLHYINKSQCPFGSSCTYAHGEEELQMTKLLDLHEAGLIDVSTYRTVPCLTYVSTGSCPFGKRCHGIHDPRVAGTQQSWLPHTETQGNTIATDINVDALHQKRLFSILHNNPFGSLFDPKKDTFQDLYDLICNSTASDDASTTGTLSNNYRTKNASPRLEEHHKLSIALQMRGGSNFSFKFRPQHIIYDELCMVLQKRAFRLTREEAVEIPLSMYNYRSHQDVLVREIAFGPDWEPTVRGVGLWFGIADSDMTLCTPQQAKRYRFKRGLNKKTTKKETILWSTVSRFDTSDSFAMIRPSERDAYGLSSAILDHRLAVLKAGRIPNLCEQAMALERLEMKRQSLEECFNGMLRGWNTWAWPINEGRDQVDENTPVPSVDSAYKASNKETADIANIWEAFAACDFEFGEPQREDTENFVIPTKNDIGNEDSRLNVFKHLGEGLRIPCAEGSKMPHINDSNDDGFEETGPNAIQSRRCWKSLLLKPTSANEYSEWQIVCEHFQNSRSRKVLSILQL